MIVQAAHGNFSNPTLVWANLETRDGTEQLVQLLRDDSAPIIKKTLYIAVEIIGQLAIAYFLGFPLGAGWIAVTCGVCIYSSFQLDAKMRSAYGERCIIDITKNATRDIYFEDIKVAISEQVFYNPELISHLFEDKKPGIKKIIDSQGKTSLLLNIIEKKTHRRSTLFAYYLTNTSGKFPKWYCDHFTPGFAYCFANNSKLPKWHCDRFTPGADFEEPDALQTVKDIIDGKHDTYELRRS